MLGRKDNGARGVTRGRVNKEPPTPYEYVMQRSGGGIGVSNLAVQRSHTPPLDSYRGRQGIQVLRNLNVMQPACFVPCNAVRTTDPVAVNEVNYSTNLVPLFARRRAS